MRFYDDHKWMDKRKQRAFYVDLDKKNPGRILTPQDEYEFVKSDVQEVINSHKYFIEYWKAFDTEIRKTKRLPLSLIKYQQKVKDLMKKIEFDSNI